MSARSRDPATIRFVDVDGVRLRTSVRGSGPPLLVITGLGASLDVAEPFERELVERGIQVVSFDAPGVGESTAYGWPRRMPGVAGTVRSDGGGARVRPDRRARGLARRCGRPAARSPGAEPRAPPRAGRHRPGARRRAGIARRRCSRSPRRAATTSRTTTGGSPGGSTAAWPAPIRTCCCAGRSPASSSPRRCADTSASSTPSRGWTSLPWLHGLRQPTLVLAGDDDPIVPSINGRILAWCIPGARLHVVRGGGHLFLLERPSEMAALVADFVVGAGDRSR